MDFCSTLEQKDGEEKIKKTIKTTTYTFWSGCLDDADEEVDVEEVEVEEEAAAVVARCSIVSSLDEILLQVWTNTDTLFSRRVRRVFMHVLISVTCCD